MPLLVDGACGVPAMVGVVQTFGDLIHWHSHIHTIVTEGVFTETGDFVSLPYVWKHSGFGVDNSVRLKAGDHEGMQRLVEYIARCPFSLARMVTVTDEGNVLYRAGKGKCFPFPKTGDEDLTAGIPRNYEMFDPLDFLAEVTQHIPNKGEHQIRYYGWYSNKKRGMREKQKVAKFPGLPEPDTVFSQKRRMTWAALIKCVYEVDPLKCPTPVVSLPNHAAVP